MKISEFEELHYPQCPLCRGSVRRPCTLKLTNAPEPLIVCSACFRLAMTLSRMAKYGIIEGLP